MKCLFDCNPQDLLDSHEECRQDQSEECDKMNRRHYKLRFDGTLQKMMSDAIDLTEEEDLPL